MQLKAGICPHSNQDQRKYGDLKTIAQFDVTSKIFSMVSYSTFLLSIVVIKDVNL